MEPIGMPETNNAFYSITLCAALAAQSVICASAAWAIAAVVSYDEEDEEDEEDDTGDVACFCTLEVLRCDL